MDVTPEAPAGPTRSPSAKRRAKFTIGAGVIVLGLVAMITWATARPAAISFYMTPTELISASGPTAGDEYRVNGTVIPGSIEVNGLETSFAITDGTTEVPVVTDRPMPDTFRDRSEIVARGVYEDSTFVASEVLAKCPSKFKAKS